AVPRDPRRTADLKSPDQSASCRFLSRQPAPTYERGAGSSSIWSSATSAANCRAARNLLGERPYQEAFTTGSSPLAGNDRVLTGANTRGRQGSQTRANARC